MIIKSGISGKVRFTDKIIIKYFVITRLPHFKIGVVGSFAKCA